jgi:hypothetical protein
LRVLWALVSVLWALVSTFGKKSLVWWNYDNSGDKLTNKRFINTSVDLQLRILEKWYPLGTKVYIWNWLNERYNGDIWVIEKYEMLNGYWNICIFSETKYSKYHKTILPTICLPLPEEIKRIIRDIKLNKMFDI